MSEKNLSVIFISILLLIPISKSFGADVEEGRRTATQCAVCHGINGEGNGAPKSCIACIDVHLFKKHVHDFKSGARKNVMMERFVKYLTDQDVENLVAYYSTK